MVADQAATFGCTARVIECGACRVPRGNVRQCNARTSPNSCGNRIHVSPPSVLRKSWPRFVQTKRSIGLDAVGRDAPHRTVQRAWQRESLPGIAAIHATQQPPIVPGRPVAIREKYDRRIVGSSNNRTSILPRRVEGRKPPMLTVVVADMQAAVGGCEDARGSVSRARHGDAMNVG